MAQTEGIATASAEIDLFLTWADGSRPGDDRSGRCMAMKRRDTVGPQRKTASHLVHEISLRLHIRRSGLADN